MGLWVFGALGLWGFRVKGVRFRGLRGNSYLNSCLEDSESLKDDEITI